MQGAGIEIGIRPPTHLMSTISNSNKPPSPSLGEEFRNFSYVRALQSLSAVMLPAIAESLMSQEPGLEAVLTKLADVLDRPVDLNSQQMVKLREFVEFSQPYCLQAPGSVKFYERYFLERLESGPYDLLHSFTVNHRLSSNSALEYIGTRFEAVHFREPALIDRLAFDAMPKRPDATFPELDMRTMLLRPGESLLFDASLLETHNLSVSRAGRIYYYGAICIGSQREARINMHDCLLQFEARGEAPFVWHDDFESSFLRPLRREEYFMDEDTEGKSEYRSAITMSLEKGGGTGPLLQVANLGPDVRYLRLLDPATIPWVRPNLE